MKFWLKYFIAIIIGIICGLVIPTYGGDTKLFFEQFFEYIIHIGRYLLFPLIFFTIATTSYELLTEKRLLRIYVRMFCYTLLLTTITTILGVAFITIFRPEYVPIIIKEAVVNTPPNLGEQLIASFPKNFFTIFTGNGDFILPIIIAAIIMSIGFLHSHSFATPVLESFNGIVHILYNLNRIMLEILTIGMFFMSSYRVIQLREIRELELFSRLLLIIIIATLCIILIFIPLFLYISSRKKHNPYTWLLSILPTIFTATLSGDNYFTLSSIMEILSNKTGENNRKVTPSLIAIGITFSRAGVAMVTCMSFILILRSYSSLDITFFQYLWIIGSSILISFMIVTTPNNAVIVSLAIICGWYTQGLEESFLILLPIAPILTSIAVLLDTVILVFNCYLISMREEKLEN